MVNKERVREVLRMVLMMLEGHSTPGFNDAVQDLLRAKQGLRARTLSEIRSVCFRLMREVPGLASRKVGEISRSECEGLIKLAPTPRQQRKFRTILHGLFAHCCRQEWGAVNPVEWIATPRLQEHEIVPLAWHELKHLLSLARAGRHRCCMPPRGAHALGRCAPGRIAPFAVVGYRLGGIRHFPAPAAQQDRRLPPHSVAARSPRLVARAWSGAGKHLPAELDEKVAAPARRRRPFSLAARCAAPYICQLPREAFSRFCPLAGGYGAPLCCLAPHALPEHAGAYGCSCPAVLDSGCALIRFFAFF